MSDAPTAAASAAARRTPARQRERSAAPLQEPLGAYKAKRDFTRTPEPAAGGQAAAGALTYVIQKHWATRLHYDLRLELDGVMLSWAVPKGPSYDPRDKRMAVRVEDHPISYAAFEGSIPAGQYGAGKVIVWDRGYWVALGDPQQGLQAGQLKFELHGNKLKGRWTLVRMKGKGEKQEPWLLIKEKDALVRPSGEFSVVDEQPDSVSGLPWPAMPVASAPAAGGARHAAAKKPSRAKLQPTQDAWPAAAKPSALPAALAPQLATLASGMPANPDEWLFEIKFDGYRILARVEGADVKLLTRNGHDWSSRLATLCAELQRAGLPSGWYDGEIVVPDEHGVPDFGALQRAFDGEALDSVVFYLFDVPHLEGHDLRALPLQARRDRLQHVLAGVSSQRLRLSETFDAPPDQLMASACRMGLEGLIGKRRDSAYRSGRSTHWIKLKCGQRQEFVVGGYTAPKGARSGFGSLMLGVHDAQGALQYAGNVGSGFDEKTLVYLQRHLEKQGSAASPFAGPVDPPGKPHWVRPSLVVEVSFAEWTRDARVRHAVFRGMRRDKPAQDITRERPRAAAAAKTARSAANTAMPKDAPSLSSRLKITHGDRVIDPHSGITKVELVRYYDLVGPLMLPHLAGRPTSLVRAPDGVEGELFFQKHIDTAKLAGLRTSACAGSAPAIEVATRGGLLALAQWNAIELHTSNMRAPRCGKADRMIFDLDPGEGVGWPHVQEAAALVHAFLEQLGLAAFLKTSGGKGLHVVVPIKPVLGFEEVKAFSQAIVVHVAKTIPQRFVAQSGPKHRVGKIFIDYLRNGEAATTVCAWSARARSGMGISVPLAWDELPDVRGGDHWTVLSAHERLDRGNGPWEGYARAARVPGPAMKKLGFTPGQPASAAPR